jgi:hypothetical protein
VPEALVQIPRRRADTDHGLHVEAEIDSEGIREGFDEYVSADHPLLHAAASFLLPSHG